MPMPGEPVTNERLETMLIGIATQIASGMSEVRTEMSALVNEAELRWQAKLDEQVGGPGAAAATGAPFDPAGLHDELAQSQAATEQKFHAQNAELQQLALRPGGGRMARRSTDHGTARTTNHGRARHDD